MATPSNEPSKKWKAYAFCKSLVSALITDKQTRSEGKTFCKRGSLAAAGPLAYAAVQAVAPMLLAIPLVTPIAATVCAVSAIGFGIAAWRAGRRMCNTSAVESNLIDEKRKWNHAQANPGFIRRLLPFAPVAACSAAAVIGGATASSFIAERALGGQEAPHGIRVVNNEIQNMATINGRRPSDEQLLIGSAFMGLLGAAGTAKAAFDLRRRNKPSSGISPAPTPAGITPAPKAPAPKP